MKQIEKYLPWIAGILVIVYFAKDLIFKGSSSPGSDASNLPPLDPIPTGSNTGNQTDDKKIEPYLYDWLKKGSKGTAVTKTQQRLNMLIDMCKKAYDDKLTLENAPSTSIERMNKIAKWQKLTTDGSFGQKTEDLVSYVMGAKETSLYKVRKKYDQFKYLIDEN